MKAKRTLTIFLAFLLVFCNAVPVFAQSQWSFGYTGNIVEWRAPHTGTYRIQVRGAGGGACTRYNRSGGKGAYMSGEIHFDAGTRLKILVGEKGEDGRNSGGGGGGSFVAYYDSNTPIVVAGGGGGAGAQRNGVDAVTTTSGTSSSDGRNPGGDNGQGAGGAGFYGDGKNGAKSFINGGAGAVSNDSWIGNGGFGGGGCGHEAEDGYSDEYSGGGGGGYSGGANGRALDGSGGGGGGSYSILQNQNNRAGDNTGNGSVIITLISVDGIPTISSPVSGSKYQTVPLSAYHPTALEYHWQYSLDGSSYTTITTTSSMVYDWDIPDTIPNDTQIYIRVRGRVGSAYTPYSSPVVITKGVDDLVGARLAAEAAAQAAAQTQAMVEHVLQVVQNLAQNNIQVEQRLSSIEKLMQSVVAGNLKLYWDSNRTATKSDGEWLNISAFGTDLQYRYRIDDGAFNPWESLDDRVYITLGSTPGYKIIVVQLGVDGIPLAEKQIGIWKLQ